MKGLQFPEAKENFPSKELLFLNNAPNNTKKCLKVCETVSFLIPVIDRKSVPYVTIIKHLFQLKEHKNSGIQ